MKRSVFATDTISQFPKRDQVLEDMYFLTEKIAGFHESSLTFPAPENEESFFLQREAMNNVSLSEEDLRFSPDISPVYSFTTYLCYLGTVSSIGDTIHLIFKFRRPWERNSYDTARILTDTLCLTERSIQLATTLAATLFVFPATLLFKIRARQELKSRQRQG